MEHERELYGRLTKVCDGVFIGGKACSSDVDFMLSNKISGVVNCCDGVIPNSLAKYGVRYCTLYTNGNTPIPGDGPLPGPNTHSQPTAPAYNSSGLLTLTTYANGGGAMSAMTGMGGMGGSGGGANAASAHVGSSQHDRVVHMFDPKGRVMKQIHHFIDDIRNEGGGVLVHSIDGNSRAVCAVVSYLCLRFGWSDTKAVELVTYRRTGSRPNASLLAQLKIAAKFLRLPNDDQTSFTDRWMHHTASSALPAAVAEEELVLRNTFLNSCGLTPDPMPDIDPTSAAAIVAAANGPPSPSAADSDAAAATSMSVMSGRTKFTLVGSKPPPALDTKTNASGNGGGSARRPLRRKG